MALFQKSVLNKYLKLQDASLIEKAYKKYIKYFHNTKIQQNILISKEEQFQQKFLIELFEKVFGYTIFPDEKFNITTEFKNLKGAKKADGAILVDGKALCVIELKGTNTKDLESIRQQAFDYKSNHPTCKYIITSNFEKIRFYIETSDELEEFNLFTLTKKEFELLYLCIYKDNLLNNIPLQIKKDSIVVEESITKKFYNDYSLFKRELFRDLVKKNLKNPVYRSELLKEDTDSANKKIKLSLFKKSQKLIDRFLFIFFAEDRGLLPPNSTLKILKDWNKLTELDAEVPLYKRFKLYFKYLDTGRAGTNKKAEIFAYNGGLFKPDAILDSLILDDNLLYKHTKTLSEYDFESQVDVNILGHIFENSLNEIESVNAEIEGTSFDKQKTKRKKDGVFYTPKYITKYIVENTIGKLCDERKTELGFKEEEYFKGRKNRNKATITKLVTILDDYRDWLLQLTICDPACGSGAFLNQALDFLIKEHTYIDELKTKVLGGGLQFPDIENTILENNIYGVDLNEESVEIAKLSLWLRTAQPRRKLNDLSSNIKCGNSLIDSKAVAGDKAFNWQEQFSKVFEKGGFDVIIGNPPYGAQITKVDQKYYLSKYETPSYKLDTYSIFIEKAFSLVKFDGFICYIVPYTWLTINQHQKLREFILNYNLIEVINLPQKIFDDADLDTVIVNLQKSESNPILQFGSIQEKEIVIGGNLNLERIKKSNDKLINLSISESDIHILDKLQSFNSLENTFEVSQGYIPYRRSDLIKNFGKEEGNAIVDGRLWHSDIKHSEEWNQEIQGRDLSRYFNSESFQYIKYGKHLAGYVDEKFFTNPRILVMEVTRGNFYKITSTFVTKEYYNTPSIINIIHPDNNVALLKALGCVINSRLMTWYHLKVHPKANAITSIPKILINDLRKLPVCSEIIVLSEIASNRLQQGSEVSILFLKFQKYIITKFQLQKLSKKLQKWYELEFGEFIRELNKAIKVSNKLRVKDGLEEVPTLTKKDEFEWLDLFEENKQKAQALQVQISQTDKEIDGMVYELYNLTPEEITIVENS